MCNQFQHLITCHPLTIPSVYVQFEELHHVMSSQVLCSKYQLTYRKKDSEPLLKYRSLQPSHQ